MSNGTERRRSIFGPILLIAIGVVFLMAQFKMLPIANVWQMFADYWPVLLILWGVAKLIDYFSAQATGGPARASLSGGEVVLLVFLILFGLAASGVNWLRTNPRFEDEFGPFWGRTYSFPEEVATKSVKPNSEITVRLDRGDIAVVADESTEMKVSATKSINSESEERAKERVAAASVAVRETAAGYEIASVTTGDAGRNVRLNIEIHLPRQAALNARTGRGDIRITNVDGKITVATPRGDVEVRGAGNDVTAELTSGTARVLGAGGNVRVTGRGTEVEISEVGGEALVQGEFYGPIRLSKVAKQAQFLSSRTDLTVASLPGRIDTSSGELEVVDVAGAVSLTTRDRDISMANIAGRIKITNRRGNVELRLQQAPKDEIEVTNERGSVDLILPSSSTFEISATTRRGEVDSDFQAGELSVAQERDQGRIEGKIGAKGPRIILKTTYGTVSLRKGIETPPPGK
jgi:hypothetical protein